MADFKLISGNGALNSTIMFVDDTGTLTDKETGEALSGPAARLINSFLSQYEYDIKFTYKTLLIKDAIEYNGPNKKRRDAAIEVSRKACLTLTGKTYEDILVNEIIEIHPLVIVPLGELSLNFLAGQRSITQFRGSILPPEQNLHHRIKNFTTRIIPTLGPRHLFINEKAKTYVSLDYKKIVENRENVSPIEEQGLVWVAETYEAFQNFLRRMLPAAEFLVFDIETYLGIPTCISFCFDGKESCCVPLLDKNVDYANSVMLFDAVVRLLASEIPKVNQNIKYDQNVLENFQIKVNNVIGDTYLRTSVLYPELPHNLGFLTSIYTSMPYFKNEGREFDPALHQRKRLYLYNAKDSLATHQIFKKQQIELQELELVTFERKIQQLYEPYRQMEKRGILVSQERLQDLKSKYNVLYDIYTLLLSDLVQKQVNPLSSKQMIELVYEDLRFPEKRRKETGNLSTQDEFLENLLVFSPNASRLGEAGSIVLELILFCRKLHKSIEFLNTAIHPDGRFKASYNLGGTETGRTSSGETTDELMDLVETSKGFKVVRDHIGHNLQNIGKHGYTFHDEEFGTDLRDIFIPTPGYVLVEGDLSQAEARVDAVLASDYEFLKEFDKKPGVHCLTGSWVFGCDPTEIKKGSREYLLSKIVRHAGERNIGAARLVLISHKPLSFCENLLTKFHKAQPKIKDVFHHDIVTHVRHRRNLVSPHGRRRDFFGKVDNHMFNEAISYLPQATVSDQIKFSIPLIESEMKKDALFLYEGHDALMFEVKEDAVDKFKITFKEFVERPIDFTGCSLSRDFDLVIPTELEWSKESWGSMKKLP